MQGALGYWRRFAALVTGWLNRYRGDPFFRTEVNVISLQITFGLVLLGLVAVFFDVLHRDIVEAVLDGLRSSLSSPTVSPEVLSASIVARIEQIRSENLLTVSAVFIVATAVCGWIVARVTLTPARNALTAQKQFIGNIAHEIRTPLSVIKTNTEVTLLDPTLPSDVKQTLHSNVEELDRISEIINNLLSLSALVRPDRIEFATVDLAAITDDTLDKFVQLARKNEIRVGFQSSADAIVLGSKTALQQIIGNIFKNALSYTPRGGSVEVAVQPSGRFVAFSVEDSGIGIARNDLFRIFEPFYRTDQSRNRSQGGSGLGLAIVSELVKLHQGKIVIRSAVGRGTTVTVLIPAARRKAETKGAELGVGQHEIAVDFSKRA